MNKFSIALFPVKKTSSTRLIPNSGRERKVKGNEHNMNCCETELGLTFSLQHLAQNTRPQRRQWCFRLSWLNLALHDTHVLASVSDTHLQTHRQRDSSQACPRLGWLNLALHVLASVWDTHIQTHRQQSCMSTSRLVELGTARVGFCVWHPPKDTQTTR